MTYCIDQAARRITVELVPVDSLHYTHVPLARAIMKARRDLRIGNRYLTLEMRENDPRASYSVALESEMNNVEEIKEVHRAAQTWLSEQISRLKAMKADMEILKVAEYDHNGTAH
jgi:hypothetical protein